MVSRLPPRSLPPRGADSIESAVSSFSLLRAIVLSSQHTSNPSDTVKSLSSPCSSLAEQGTSCPSVSPRAGAEPSAAWVDQVTLDFSPTLVKDKAKTGLRHKVHIGISQGGFDHILPVISDALDAVTKAWRLRDSTIDTPKDDVRFAELTRQTLSAVCSRSGIPFRLRELPPNSESKAGTTMLTDHDLTAISRQVKDELLSKVDALAESEISRQVKDELLPKVDALAESDWSLKGTIDLQKLKGNLQHAASYLEARSLEELVEYDLRSVQCAQATAAVMELIRELKPNALTTKQWEAMKERRDDMPAW
jgi:hypothetical protein